MSLQKKTQSNGLVEILVDSRLPVVGKGPLEALDVPAGQQALLIEKVGERQLNGLECWHALIDGQLILLWSDAFNTQGAR